MSLALKESSAHATAKMEPSLTTLRMLALATMQPIAPSSSSSWPAHLATCHRRAVVVHQLHLKLAFLAQPAQPALEELATMLMLQILWTASQAITAQMRAIIRATKLVPCTFVSILATLALICHLRQLTRVPRASV